MRIYQVMDALDYGDGVSNSVINTHLLLNKMGIENQIYSKWWNDRVRQYTMEISKLRVKPDDIVIYHFSGKSHIIDEVSMLPCQRVLCYHNVTPPEFFKDNNPQAYENCLAGLRQLAEKWINFHYFCAVSEFNMKDLMSYGISEKKIDVLPIVMNLERLDNVPYNQALYQSRKSNLNIIFVGRVAPNKRIEDILDIFENLYCYYRQDVKLTLVGNTDDHSHYAQMLMSKLAGLRCKEQVTFTGKVTSDDLYAYYKSSDVFLCMSEHEGFCIPLIEAMYFKIPVVAYNSCAIPYTMGGAGVLVHRKDIPVIAGLLDSLLNDHDLRNRIISRQSKNIQKYTTSALQCQLQCLIDKWSVKHV